MGKTRLIFQPGLFKCWQDLRETYEKFLTLTQSSAVQSITAQVLTKNSSFGSDEIRQSVTFSGDLKQRLEFIVG